MKYCKTCGSALLVRPTRHKGPQTQKAYYYTAYYYCPSCKKMYLDDKFKVMNGPGVLLFSDVSTQNETVDVEIWTDGACTYNGTARARAAWAYVSGKHEESGTVEGKQTNNTAEAYAIYHALRWASEKGYKKIRIYSDSQITLHGLQKPVEKVKVNREIFQKIADLIAKEKLQVFYEKVPGHADDVNNNRADKLANGLVGIK